MQKNQKNVKQVRSENKKIEPKKTGKNKKQAKKEMQQTVKNAFPKTVGAALYSPNIISSQAKITINANFINGCINNVIAAYNAYMLQHGVSSNSDFDYTSYYGGLVILLNGVVSEIQGSPSLDRRPKIFHDFIAALQPKSVRKYNGGVVSFGWDQFTNAFGSMQLPQGNLTQQYVTSDTGKYDSPSMLWDGSSRPQDYNAFLGYVDSMDVAKRSWLKLVDKDDPSPLSQDPSAFSRVYPYNSSGTSSLTQSLCGSSWNSVENEFPIHNPAMSHFCAYGTNNFRYPNSRAININSGGSASSLAPLLTCERDWWNKEPARYFPVDFYDLVNRLIYYWIALNRVDVVAGVQRQQTFPFSYQDFLIMCRQALLTAFKDQWNVMEVNFSAYENGQNNFVPFTISGNTYPLNEFAKTLVPQMFLENVSQLQSIALAGRRGTKHKTVYVPVLGFRTLDKQPLWVHDNGNSVFATLPQNPIDLCFGTIGAQNAVNLNSSYYVVVMQTWNANIRAFDAVSVDVAELSQITPCHVPLGLVTRIAAVSSSEPSMPPFANDYPSTKNIMNVKHKNAKCKEWQLVNGIAKADAGGDIYYLPPIDTTKLTLASQVSVFPVTKDVQNMLDILALPLVIVDPDDLSNPYTAGAYRSTMDADHLYPLAGPFSSAPSYLDNQMNFGELCVTGIGRESTSLYNSVLSALQRKGHAGLLSGIIGQGLSMVFPQAAGVIKTVSDICPI